MFYLHIDLREKRFLLRCPGISGQPLGNSGATNAVWELGFLRILLKTCPHHES
jgi:hypothetical protein